MEASRIGYMSLEPENTVVSKSKQLLCLLCLIGTASTVAGIQMPAADEPIQVEQNCFTDPYQALDTGMVAYVHGDVFDQLGHPIEAGSELSANDIVYVKSDGFLSLHISDTRSINIQPNTSTYIACAMLSQSQNLDVTQPYRIGAIRG